MKLAIISDVHSNLEAFEAILEDIKKQAPDKIINLGDLVGYGANPHEVIELNKKHNILTIKGNHDAAVVDEVNYRLLFSDAARIGVDFTKALIGQEDRDYLKNLKNSYVEQLNNLKIRFVHGAPPDSYIEYINESSKTRKEFFSNAQEQICFVGHTHIPCAYTSIGEIKIKNLKEIEKDKKYIINVGSVGQSRDQDPRAKYCLFDTESKKFELRKIYYDVNKAAEKIKNTGLPEFLASRLKLGI